MGAAIIREPWSIAMLISGALFAAVCHWSASWCGPRTRYPRDMRAK